MRQEQLLVDGSRVQCYNRPQWIRKVEHSGFYLLCAWNLDFVPHVRATNLADLVYKRGQAGITKATVSIVLTTPTQLQSPCRSRRSQQVSYQTARQDTTRYGLQRC
ncbi:hypothetical protein BC829DRAFT_97607 [Chytridium lagenaria]|nr:hypothetical protein BC829DRAFT_97607 [Chytridium lagenaria]